MNQRVILLISLGINIGLGALLLLVLVSSKSTRPPIPSRIVVTNTVVRLQHRPVLPPLPSEQASTVVVQELDWHSIESTDYRVFIANLRAISCPEETVRDIIIADLSKVFTKRFHEKAAELKTTNQPPYWKSSSKKPRELETSISMLISQTRKEFSILIKELLNFESTDLLPNLAMTESLEVESSLSGFLPEKKAKAIAKLLSEHQLARNELQSEHAGTEKGISTSAKVKRLEKLFENQLAGLLSPEELRAYDLRMSKTAATLRKDFQDIDISETEYKSLFDLRKSFDTSTSALQSQLETAAFDPQKLVQIESALALAKKEFNEEARKRLGNSRFEDYSRNSDPYFQEARELAEMTENPPDVASRILEIRRLTEEEIRRIKSDRNITEDEIEEALTSVREESEKAVATILGKPYSKPPIKSFPDQLKSLDVRPKPPAPEEGK